MLIMLVWLGAEVADGHGVGVSERLVAGFQALWPLFVVMVILRSRRQSRWVLPGA